MIKIKTYMLSIKFNRLLVSLILLVVTALVGSAQASGDKLYNQGLELQKTMTVKAQNAAIAKFTSAKKLYDSQAKKNQCDQAINVSRGIIKQINSGGGGGRYTGNRGNEVVKESSISVSPNDFNLDNTARTVTVTVALVNVDEWTAFPVANPDGSSFLTVYKNVDNSTIQIQCDENHTTMQRQQKVEVSGGGVKKQITVTQAGVPVNLVVTKSQLDFGKNGGKKDVDLVCNSDMAYQENNGENWIVESKPDWANVVINTGTKKKGGLFDKVKDTVKEKIIGEDTAEVSGDGKVTHLIVNVDKIAKGTSEFNNGRNGEIIFRSGDKTVRIFLVQK